MIRDFNGNFVAAKVEVIVSQCCLDAHLKDSGMPYNCVTSRDIRRFNLRANNAALVLAVLVCKFCH